MYPTRVGLSEMMHLSEPSDLHAWQPPWFQLSTKQICTLGRTTLQACWIRPTKDWSSRFLHALHLLSQRVTSLLTFSNFFSGKQICMWIVSISIPNKILGMLKGQLLYLRLKGISSLLHIDVITSRGLQWSNLPGVVGRIIHRESSK